MHFFTELACVLITSKIVVNSATMLLFIVLYFDNNGYGFIMAVATKTRLPKTISIVLKIRKSSLNSRPETHYITSGTTPKSLYHFRDDSQVS